MSEGGRDPATDPQSENKWKEGKTGRHLSHLSHTCVSLQTSTLGHCPSVTRLSNTDNTFITIIIRSHSIQS
uniref:Uncharacterized protein n=1 Tax=Onchocerca volvulus TaxID=6282 RepID=A0A8R1TT99_ONCVO